MKRWTVHFLASLAVLTLLFGVGGTVQAGIINGGFETGDTSGWVTAPGYLTSATTFQSKLGEDGSWTPVQGYYFGYLTAGADADTYTTMSQSFSANAGDVLSFHTFFDAGDYMPFNDDAYAKLINPDASITPLYLKDVAAVGNFGSDGWTPIVHGLTQSGTYTLEFGVRNTLDNEFSSAMGVDAVNLKTGVVPEPGTLTLAGLGVIGLFGYGWRRRPLAAA